VSRGGGGGGVAVLPRVCCWLLARDFLILSRVVVSEVGAGEA